MVNHSRDLIFRDFKKSSLIQKNLGIYILASENKIWPMIHRGPVQFVAYDDFKKWAAF